MCSYQSLSEASHYNLLRENLEQNPWAKMLSPNSSVASSNCFQPHVYENSQAVQIVCKQNDGDVLQDFQMQFTTPCYNVESSSLMSPAWEDQESAFHIPQHCTNTSIYFSTFDPSSQFEDVPLHKPPAKPMSQAKPQYIGNKKMHDARISLVPIGNGNFKTIVKRKRKRTTFTTEQLQVLEQVFSEKPYVTRDERQVLVEQLQVNDKSVKIWFQNRRLKNKRDDQHEVNQDNDNSDLNNCRIFDRLDNVESEIIERTDENGFVTLDDKIINDLVNIVDDYLTSNISAVETKTEIDDSPTYEPISPASTSEYSCEDNTTNWQYYERNDLIQELLDIESIIST